jgi:cation diffusion facilitator CzcD-associated flavoprotein CzcO
LQQRRIPFQILEKQTVGHVWQQHYDRLRLHTLKQVSGLPERPMPADYPEFPNAAQVHAYLREYATHFDLPITEHTELLSAQFVDQRWQLATSRGQIEADYLVMTTGIWSQPVLSRLPGQATFGGTIMHSARYRNAQPFLGQHTLVVGVGNSGSEIAVDLAEHGVPTTIAVRGGAAFVPRPRSAVAMRGWDWATRTLPRALMERLVYRQDFASLGLPLPKRHLLDAYPVVGYELPEAVAAGRVAVRPAVVGFVPGHAVFADGSVARCDAVIMATGYRPGLDHVAADVDRDSRGWPVLDSHWRSLRNPRLLCVGFRYPATAGWLQSIGRFAEQAVAGIGD